MNRLFNPTSLGKAFLASAMFGSLFGVSYEASAMQRLSPEMCAHLGRSGVSTSSAECPEGGVQSWPGLGGDKPRCRYVVVDQPCATGICKVSKRMCKPRDDGMY